jgi:hypothetical protein
MQPSQADVVSQIEAAFPSDPIDFEGALAGGLDDGAYRQHVDGKRWRELDRAYVLSRSDALSFLAPAHIAAVLPLYLQSLVEDGTRTPAPDTLLLVLNRKSQERFQELVDALTVPQRAAVVAALELFASRETGQPADAARDASERWKRLLSTTP